MKREFKVGDVCRVREWDDMAAEFRICRNHIMTTPVFVPAMKYLCGQTFTIKTISENRRCTSEEGIERPPGVFPWAISTDMLELLIAFESENEEFEFDFDLSNLLGY